MDALGAVQKTNRPPYHGSINVHINPTPPARVEQKTVAVFKDTVEKVGVARSPGGEA
jgi:hypothetical protein